MQGIGYNDVERAEEQKVEGAKENRVAIYKMGGCYHTQAGSYALTCPTEMLEVPLLLVRTSLLWLSKIPEHTPADASLGTAATGSFLQF